MALISYDAERWPQRKDFYQWIEAEGFTLDSSVLRKRFCMTASVLFKYLGQFDYVRRRVDTALSEDGKAPPKQVAFFRPGEVYEYLDGAVTCSRRTRYHRINESVYLQAQKAFDTAYKETKDVIKASIAQAQFYIDYGGYKSQAAWLMTPSGQFRASKVWYKVPPVPCEQPEAWYLFDMDKIESRSQHKDMTQRAWYKSAAIKIELQSSTTDQRYTMHWMPPFDPYKIAVPAIWEDADMQGYGDLPGRPDGKPLGLPAMPGCPI